jgi:hypothetical protein
LAAVFQSPLVRFRFKSHFQQGVSYQQRRGKRRGKAFSFPDRSRNRRKFQVNPKGSTASEPHRHLKYDKQTLLYATTVSVRSFPSPPW